MAATDDFFIRFGSNASTFAEQLKTDLSKAKTEITNLNTLLNQLDENAKAKIGPLGRALAAAEAKAGNLAGNGNGANPNGGGELYTSKLQDAMDSLAGDMGKLKTDLLSIVATLGKAVRGSKEYWEGQNRSEGQMGTERWRDSGGVFRTPGTPGTQREVLGISNVLSRHLDQLSRGQNPSNFQPTRLSISGLAADALKLDQGGFDRVVGAVNEVRDALRSLAARPISITDAVVEKAAAVQASPARVAAPATTTATTQAAPDQTARETKIRQDLAEIRVDMQRLAAIVTAAGGAVDDELTNMLEKLRGAESKAKAELAQIERETTGVTRGQQSEARRAQAAAERGPDLAEEEYNRRVQMRQMLDLAMSPEQFKANVGRGANQLGMKDLRSMAAQLEQLGFSTPHSSRVRQPQLVENILSSRQAMFGQYGTSVPEELRTGKKILADRVSEEVKGILRQLNISAEEAVQETAAREQVRMAYQAGHIPPEVAQRLPAGVEVPGSIKVPPAMVKGGSYTDVYGLMGPEGALSILRGRALGRAANLAMNPEYNPYQVDIGHEGIAGQGAEATHARQAMRALRGATHELDQLGRIWEQTQAALQEAEAFVERANYRLGRQARGESLTPDQRQRVETDPANIVRAQTQIGNLQRILASDQFKGLQDVFGSAEYQTGRRRRDVTLALQQEEADRAAREAQVYVSTRGAAGQAYVGTRLAPGTKETYIRDMPGLIYDKNKEKYRLDERLKDPTKENIAELERINKAWQAVQAGLRKERRIVQQIEEGTKTRVDLEAQKAITENKASRFSSHVEQLLSFSRPMQDLIGRGPSDPAMQAKEAQRQAAYLDVRRAATAKLTPNTPEEILAQRERGVAAITAKLESSRTVLHEADARLAKAEQAAAAAQSKMTAEEKAAHDQRIAAERELFNLETKAMRFPQGERYQVPPGSQGPRMKSGLFVQNEGAWTDLQNQIAAAQHALAQLTPSILSEDVEVKKATDAQRRAQRNLDSLATALTAAQRRLDEQRSSLRGVSSKVPETAQVGTQEERQAAKAVSEELRQMAKAINEATAIQRRLTELRGPIKAGNRAGTDVSALTAERDALKASPAFMLQNDIKALRKRYVQAMGEATGGGAGGGGIPPTASGAAGAAGRGGGDAETNQILRQILESVNSLHATVKGGVKVTGAAAPTGTTAATAATRTATSATTRSIPTTAMTDQQRADRAQGLQELRGYRQQLTDVRNQQASIRLTDEQNRLSRMQERQVQRTTAAQLEQARATVILDEATRNLSRDAVAELDKLAALSKAGANATEIARQQARAYQAVAESMGGSATSQRPVHAALQSEALGRPVTGGEIESVARVAKIGDAFQTAEGSVDKTVHQMATLVGQDGPFGAALGAMFGSHGFWSRVMASTGTFIVRNFTAGFVFGITNALQEILRQGIVTESTFIRISDALEQTGRSAGNLRTQLQDISSQYGVALNDVYDTAAGLVGLFSSVNDIAGATKVVAQLQSISMGALNAQEAMGALASITGAYGDELRGGVDGLSQVADTLTVIQNVIGTNVEVTAEGVGALSGLSKQLKIDFADTATYVAQIAKLTNQTGAAAGEQFGRILASMQTGRARSAIQKALPNSGIDQLIGAGQYGKALRVLLQNWDGLSDAQKRNLTVTIAGQRQARAFTALMNNSTKVLNAAAEAHDANGQAAARAAAIAKQLNQQMVRLGVNLQDLAQNLVRTGLLDFFGLFLRVANEVLHVVNDLLSRMNDVADNTPMIGMLKHLVAGFVGFALTINVAMRALAGFKATLAGIRAAEATSVGMTAAQAFIGGRATAATGGTGGYMGFWPSLAALPGGAATRFRDRAETLRESARARYQTLPSRGSAGPGVIGASPWAGTPREPRVFAVSGAGTAVEREAQNLTRVQRMQASGQLALAKASGAAAKSMDGLSRGVTALGSAGLATQVGIGVAIALILDGINQVKERSQRAQRYEDLYKQQYGDGGRARTKVTDQLHEYVGPFTQQSQQTRKDTGGVWNAIRYMGWGKPMEEIRHPLDTIKSRVDSLVHGNPLGLTAFGDYFNGKEVKAYNAYRGILPDDVGTRLTGMREQINKRLMSAGSATGMDQNAITAPFDAIRQAADQSLDTPFTTVKEAKKLNADIAKKIQAERAKINQGDMSAEQKTTALAALEEMAKTANDRVATMILMARGIAQADALTTDQIQQIDTVTQTLSQVAGSGSGVSERYASSIHTLIKETGVRAQSTVGKALADMGKSGTTAAEALDDQRKIVRVQVDNLQAKLDAADSGKTPLDDEDRQQVEQLLAQKLTTLGGLTNQIIQGFIDESTNLANLAIAQGAYGSANKDIQAAIDKIANERRGKKEDRVTRAVRDLQVSQLYEQKATNAAARRTAPLELAAARSPGQLQQAQEQAAVAHAQYNALKRQQTLAARVGDTGPSLKAIHDAKIAWIQAEQQLAQTAQSANIARMTAQAAGIWNEVAGAQAQEGIALQQYRDAVKNFGKGSAEALNALASYKNSQKSTQQTQDQVAQATREAAAAAIPQGDAVAVANAGVRNAQAALAEARKYGVNSSEYQSALAQLYSAQQQAQSAQSAVAQAQAQLAQAYAEARGDTVGAARAGVAVARAALNAALKASGGARSADVINAQAQLVQANAAVNQAQADFVRSRLDVSIAISTAAGHTVRTAILQLRQARIALAFARRQSGGKVTQAVREARAQAIQADAAVRDARLQDSLDTIDFNLQMGRMTQSAAISALRQILKTRDLTKQQRRQLLLQIKGMQNELSGSPWNFGDIKLPAPYLVRRYIEQQRSANSARADKIIADAATRQGVSTSQGPSYYDHSTTTILINGADVAKVRKIVQDVVGKAGKTMTVQSRRR